MSNNKYHARVREIAEEMYYETRRTLDVTIPIGTDKKEETVNALFIPLASIAVKNMAEQYRKGFDAGYFDRIADNVTIDEWLKIIGLSPSLDQPEGTGI